MRITTVMHADEHIALLEAFKLLKAMDSEAEAMVVRAFEVSGEDTELDRCEMDILNVEVDEGTIKVYAELKGGGNDEDEDQPLKMTMYLTMVRGELHGAY